MEIITFFLLGSPNAYSFNETDGEGAIIFGSLAGDFVDEDDVELNLNDN